MGILWNGCLQLGPGLHSHCSWTQLGTSVPQTSMSPSDYAFAYIDTFLTISMQFMPCPPHLHADFRLTYFIYILSIILNHLSLLRHFSGPHRAISPVCVCLSVCPNTCHFYVKEYMDARSCSGNTRVCGYQQHGSLLRCSQENIRSP